MADIGFPDSAEDIVSPNHSAPQDTAVDVTSHWGALAQVLSFFGQRLLYSILVLLAVIFLTYIGLSMDGGTVF